MLQKHGEIYILDGRVLLPGLNYIQSFGKALTHFRKKKGAKQNELVVILGIEAPAISKIESGGSCANVVQLKLMCMFYDCTPQDIYNLAEEIFLASGELSSFKD